MELLNSNKILKMGLGGGDNGSGSNNGTKATPTLSVDLFGDWQNVGYNQSPHAGFYIGEDMNEPPRPDKMVVDKNCGLKSDEKIRDN